MISDSGTAESGEPRPGHAHLTSLRRFGKTVTELRAGFAILRALHWEGHVVKGIWRPEEDPRPTGRHVDFVFELDGVTTALEVVGQNEGEDALAAAVRVREIEAAANAQFLELVDPHDPPELLFVHVTYDPAATRALSRRDVALTANAIATKAHEVTRSAEYGEDVAVHIETGWATRLSATRLESEAHRLGFMYGQGVRLLETEADQWVDAVIEAKGNQHVDYSTQAILGIVTSELIDKGDLERAWRRRGSTTPWWRIYVADLGADSAANIDVPSDTQT